LIHKIRQHAGDAADTAFGHVASVAHVARAASFFSRFFKMAPSVILNFYMLV